LRPTVAALTGSDARHWCSPSSARKATPFDVLDFVPDVQAAVVGPGRNVEEACTRAERGGIPGGNTLIARKDQRSRWRARRFSGDANGPAAFRIEAGRPVHFDERLAGKKLPRHAIEHIEITVAVGEVNQLLPGAPPISRRGA